MNPARHDLRPIDEEEAARQNRTLAHPIRSGHDLIPLLHLIGDARVVMLGEASHGSHEYYSWRALISQRLTSGPLSDPSLKIQAHDQPRM